MSDPSETPAAARAVAAGDLPRAPGFSGLCSAAGGLLGLVLAAAGAGPNVQTLAQAAFGSLDAQATLTAAVPLVARLVLMPLAGALAGLVLGQVLLRAVAFRARARLKPAPVPRLSPVWLGLALAAPALALWVLPRVTGAPDPGRALLQAAPVVVALALLLALPAALRQRGMALRRWRARVDPQPPPLRDPDEMSPEMRRALRSPPGP
jgi:hypothetical protein